MKSKTLLLSFLLSAPAFAGSGTTYEPAPQPAVQEGSWEWFVGGSGGYLFEADEDIYTFQVGANSPWSVGGWAVALYAEAGWTENHDSTVPVGALGGDPDLDIVPITFNVKLEKLITGGLSAYIGGGLGTSYVESGLSGPFESDDWVFTAQAFAGLSYHVSDNFEIFGGGRWLFFDEPNIAGADELGDDWMIEGGLRFHF